MADNRDRLDYQPSRIFIHRLVRPTYVRIAEREAAPIIAKLPPGLQDGLTATSGLIAHNLASKYCDHLPSYRQKNSPPATAWRSLPLGYPRRLLAQATLR